MAVPPHLSGHIPYKQTKNMWDLQLRIQVQSHSNPDQWLFGGSGEQVFNDKDCIVKHRNAELQFSKFLYFSIYAWIQEKCWIRICNKVNSDLWHCRQKPKQINASFFKETAAPYRYCLKSLNLEKFDFLYEFAGLMANQNKFSFSVIQVFIEHWKGSDQQRLNV